jgi:Aldo/keto reductase family
MTRRSARTSVRKRRFDPPQREVSIIGQGTWYIGESSIVCDQVLYHLQERAIEHAVLPWCEQHRLAVTAYSPFGHGDFPSNHTPGGRLLADIAKAHDATTRQIALAFVTRRPSVFAIPKRPASSMSKRMPARAIYTCRRPRSRGSMPPSRVVRVAAGCQ